MSLHDHAVRELKLSRLEEDVHPSLIAAVDAFASYGHSGTSAAVCSEVLYKLLRYEPLSPITSHPSEWMDVSDRVPECLWQNKRRSSTFSRDGGETWYDIDDSSLNNGDIWMR